MNRRAGMSPTWQIDLGDIPLASDGTRKRAFSRALDQIILQTAPGQQRSKVYFRVRNNIRPLNSGGAWRYKKVIVGWSGGGALAEQVPQSIQGRWEMLAALLDCNARYVRFSSAQGRSHFSKATRR